MKNIRTGILKPNALDLDQKVKPKEFANRTIIKRLNYIKKFVKENNETVFDEYTSKLLVTLNSEFA